jgi:hypothetical protein
MSYEELMAKSKQIPHSNKDTHHHQQQHSEMDHKHKRDTAITTTAGKGDRDVLKGWLD